MARASRRRDRPPNTEPAPARHPARARSRRCPTSPLPRQKSNETRSHRLVIRSASAAVVSSTPAATRRRRSASAMWAASPFADITATVGDQPVHVHRDHQIDDRVLAGGCKPGFLDLDPAIAGNLTDRVVVELTVATIMQRHAGARTTRTEAPAGQTDRFPSEARAPPPAAHALPAGTPPVAGPTETLRHCSPAAPDRSKPLSSTYRGVACANPVSDV